MRKGSIKLAVKLSGIDQGLYLYQKFFNGVRKVNFHCWSSPYPVFHPYWEYITLIKVSSGKPDIPEEYPQSIQSSFSSPSQPLSVFTVPFTHE